MTLRSLDGYIWLDRDPETGEPRIPDELRHQFFPEWLRGAVEHASDRPQAREFEEAFLQQVAKHLHELSQSPQNWLDRGVPVGMSKAKIGDKSVPIKEILLVSAAYSIPVFIALSAFVAGPASVVLAAKAVAAVGPAAAKLYSAVNTYSPTELDVHTAVVSAMYRNHARTLKGDGATLDEIAASFTRDKRLIRPKDLKAVLDDMASDRKKMLLRSVAGGVETFKPNPF